MVLTDWKDMPEGREIEPGVWVADDAPAWAYHAHSPQLNRVAAEDYRRSVAIDAAEKGDVWRATWAYTESGRVVPIGEITRADPSALVTAEGWGRWVRARLTKPPRRERNGAVADGQETLFAREEDAS